MPQRLVNAWTLLAAMVGLVLVGVLVIFGKDIHKSARTGPQWKRRMMAAALTLLAGVGLMQSPGCESPPRQPTCYDTFLLPQKDEVPTILDRLPGQLTALETHLSAGAVTDDVLDKAIGSVRQDSGRLSIALADRSVPADRTAEAETLLAQANALIARDARLNGE